VNSPAAAAAAAAQVGGGWYGETVEGDAANVGRSDSGAGGHEGGGSGQCTDEPLEGCRLARPRAAIGAEMRKGGGRDEGGREGGRDVCACR